jgi:hypothetical protein
MAAKAKSGAKRAMKPIRFKILRTDCSIASAQATIENDLSRPSGSVRLLNPNGRKARSDGTVGSLIRSWERAEK